MSNNIFDDLSKILTPLRRKYELEMAKKHLKYLDRYRERLVKKIKLVVIEEMKLLAKEISAKADEMGDCGGVQGAAVLYNFPELKHRLEKLEKEAEELGIRPEDINE